MSGKLKWDQTGERLFETGTTNGVLYVQASDGSYPEGVVWNGLTAVTESPSGAEANDMWADNIKYGSLRSAETFGATIEAYTYPDEFGACNGEGVLVTGTGGKAAVKIGQQKRNPFGFCYRTEIGNDTATEGDDGYKLHLIYNATASPSERAYTTVNDSPEAITFSWEISTTPVDVSGFKPTASLEIDSTKLADYQLKAIEDVLYGKDASGNDAATTARLPLPDEVKTIINNATPPSP